VISTARRLTATAATASLLALPAVALSASPAAAVQNQKSCAGANVKLEAERDDGRHEVQVDIDNGQRGERWRVKLFQNGDRFVNVVRTVGGDDRDIDLDRDRRNTAGADTYKLRAKNLRTGGACTLRVTLR
jgi:hypothetical protein